MYELSILLDYCLNGQVENIYISMYLIMFVFFVCEFVIFIYNGNGSFYVFSIYVLGFLDGS